MFRYNSVALIPSIEIHKVYCYYIVNFDSFDGRRQEPPALFRKKQPFSFAWLFSLLSFFLGLLPDSRVTLHSSTDSASPGKWFEAVAVYKTDKDGEEVLCCLKNQQFQFAWDNFVYNKLSLCIIVCITNTGRLSLISRKEYLIILKNHNDSIALALSPFSK